MWFAGLVLAALTPILVNCQIQPQTNTFGSNFQLTSAQIASLGLSQTQAESLEVAIQFEQTNWATGSVLSDPFYTTLPTKAKPAPAGSVLKVEAYTVTTNYTIAPTLSLSRIIYQSKTLNGTLVPVSAFILWPFNNRYSGAQAPLVSWGHGTSGIYPECAPSHVRNLWYHFSGPFELALSGFAVVATDFAGLGVPYYQDGRSIVHEYTANPAAGNDMLYAAQAAHAAFPAQLTKDFVVMGHSQGGGGAWGAAQQQVKAKVPGYLGSIAVSPVTSALGLSKAVGSSLGLLQIYKALPNVIPSVKVSQMLTAKGIAFVNLLQEIQGCNSALNTLIESIFEANPTTVLTKDAFLTTAAATKYDDLTVAGGKDFAGPLLIIQGTADQTVSPEMTEAYAQETCKKYGKNGLSYVSVNGVDHIPTLYASQQYWLSWIDGRFGKRDSLYGVYGAGKCSNDTIGIKTPRPLDTYTGNINFFLEYALESYTVD